jgi:hypothetical protein
MNFDFDFGSVWREGRLMNLQFVSKCSSVYFERNEEQVLSSILGTLKIPFPYLVKFWTFPPCFHFTYSRFVERLATAATSPTLLFVINSTLKAIHAYCLTFQTQVGGIKITVFQDTASCILTDHHRYFGGPYCLYLHGLYPE